MSGTDGPVPLDALDRQIVHALQVDARASFRRIGEVLEVSDQTVARRYARLRERRALRVLGVTDPAVTDDEQWIFHLRVAPDAAAEVAEGLAARPDTSWIALCASGPQIVGTVYGPGAPTLLLETIPRARAVLDVRADQVLRVFYGGAGEPFAKQGPLRAEQVRALAPDQQIEGTGPRALDTADRRIVGVLRGDGRATVEQLVAATGLVAATVRRRLHDLRACGVLHFDVDINPDVLTRSVRTLLCARITPVELPGAGERLAADRDVAFAAATTGPDNLFASVSTVDRAALYDYLTREVGTWPGLQMVTTAPVLRTVKAAATRYGARPTGRVDRPGVA